MLYQTIKGGHLDFSHFTKLKNIYRVLVCITGTFFQLCIISNLGVRVIHYNKQNHVFPPLKIGRISKRLPVQSGVEGFRYKTA